MRVLPGAEPSARNLALAQRCTKRSADPAWQRGNGCYKVRAVLGDRRADRLRSSRMEITERPTDTLLTITPTRGGEDPRADGGGARRRHDGAPRRDPGRRLLRLPVRPRLRHPAPRRATTSSTLEGVNVVVDPFSAPYLQGATIDFLERPAGVRVQDRQPERRPPRAAAATPSRWKRVPRTLPRRASAAAAPAAPLSAARRLADAGLPATMRCGQSARARAASSIVA